MSQPQQLHLHVRLEDGAYWATVAEFPGVFATGDTLDELRESAAEGIALMLAQPGEEPPAISLGELTDETTVATADLVCA